MTTDSFTVRPEESGDIDAVRSIHEAAFPTPVEARLVDALRGDGKATVSLVAEVEGEIAGHILFSPVTVDGSAGAGQGLAPVAVRPEMHSRGIGGRLIREGLDSCRTRDVPFVVVLGSPVYYGRFGFERASARGLGNEYGVDEEFMVMELCEGSLPVGGGLVRYAPEFAEADVDARNPKG